MLRRATCKRIFRDESKTWVDVVDEVNWIDAGRAFLWISERDGWRHVYRVPRDGGAARLITHFEADVTAAVGTDEANGWLYFMASPSNATQRYLYRSKLDGSGMPERVTPANQSGTSFIQSCAGRPSRFSHVVADRQPAGDRCRRIARAPLAPPADGSNGVKSEAHRRAEDGPAEFTRVDIGDGVVLDGWMLRPSNL